jgi:NAD(P)H-dependent FMN reductase
MTSSIDTSTRSLLFLLTSARAEGNSEQLARRAAEALPPNTRTDWLRLDEHMREPFQDLRHTPQGFPALSPEMRALSERTVAADELVFVTPVYWYSLPASGKLYLDHWMAWMRRPELRFRERMKGKVLSAITVNAGEDWAGQPLVESLRLTAEYMGMRWRGALIGHGARPGDVLGDAPALEAARDWLVRPLADGKRDAA